LSTCFFVSDLHGRTEIFLKLFERIDAEHPEALFLGGDFFPSPFGTAQSAISHWDFLDNFLFKELAQLKRTMMDAYPRIFIIMGNDDGRFEEDSVREGERKELWEYMHNRKMLFQTFMIHGYSYVPPTPFLLKDWERYDVSRYADPGCISPEEGKYSIPVPDDEKRYSTIKNDLDRLAGGEDLERAVFLFHAPPHQTKLDRLVSDGKMIDHVPIDPSVGSIAIKRFIEAGQPLLTLHGHIHESARLTGSWRDRIGRTHVFSGAHDGPELALIRFDLEDLDKATRELI